MTSAFDEGNIVLQKKIKINDGISIQNATKLIAEAGNQLVLDFLEALSKYSINEIAQDESLSSYQSFPTMADYRVSTLWTAKRMFNFISAYKEPGVYFLCEVDGREFKLVDALHFGEGSYANLGSQNFEIEKDEVTFSCENSYITCRLMPG